jgi:hypothetical protein
MKIISILTAVFFCASAFATTAGFQHGNDYEATSYDGSVTASCASGTRTHYCSAYGLNPTIYTKLVTAQRVDANKFEVVATHESGKRVSKDGKFKKTESKGINLWIRTLFQKPLLAFGLNKIDYKIMKNKTTVQAGSFEVMVNQGERRSCRRGFIHMSGNSCENSTSACNEYFNRGYCRK